MYPSQNFQAARNDPDTKGGKGAPLVIIEAYSQRTPVIANHLGQVPVILEQTGGGVTYQTENELVEIIGQFIRDPDYRRNLGENAFRAYEDTWTAKAHLKEYFSLIEDLSSNRKDGGTPVSHTS